MSTVDPELGWWRNARLLRVVAAVLWAVVFATAVVTGWSNALYLTAGDWEHWAGADWLIGAGQLAEPIARVAETSLMVVVYPIVVAAFVDAYARHRSGGGEGWCVAAAFGWTLFGLGVGVLVAALSAPVGWGWPALLLGLGIVALAIHPVTRWALARHADRQAWSRAHGTSATATATKVDVVIINDIHRWQVTLRYDDQSGTTRWHKATIPFREGALPKVGDDYNVRYDPEHPGRHSSIYVNLSRPLSRR